MNDGEEDAVKVTRWGQAEGAIRRKKIRHIPKCYRTPWSTRGALRLPTHLQALRGAVDKVT